MDRILERLPIWLIAAAIIGLFLLLLLSLLNGKEFKIAGFEFGVFASQTSIDALKTQNSNLATRLSGQENETTSLKARMESIPAIGEPDFDKWLD